MMSAVGKLSRAASLDMLQSADRSDFKEMFNLFDKDRRGAMDPEEVRKQMCKLGFEADNLTIYQLISDLDRDGSQKLELEEFVELMCEHLRVHSAESMSRKAMGEIFEFFDNLDPNRRKGNLELADLQRLANVFGDTITEGELQVMMKGADREDKGFVSFEDFYQVMTRAGGPSALSDIEDEPDGPPMSSVPEEPSEPSPSGASSSSARRPQFMRQATRGKHIDGDQRKRRQSMRF